MEPLRLKTKIILSLLVRFTPITNLPVYRTYQYGSVDNQMKSSIIETNYFFPVQRSAADKIMTFSKLRV